MGAAVPAVAPRSNTLFDIRAAGADRRRIGIYSTVSYGVTEAQRVAQHGGPRVLGLVQFPAPVRPTF